MKKPVALETKFVNEFVNEIDLKELSALAAQAHKVLEEKSGAGNDFLGWVALPDTYNKEEFSRICSAAKKITNTCDCLIVVGIGGSYLGPRAGIEFVKGSFHNNCKNTPEIYFVGNNLSGAYLKQVLSFCENKEVAVNVISKSGTTTESAVAFRFFKNYLEKRYGKVKARERIFATTDKAKGTLKELSDKEGYETFVIPDDIGGRFSVLTAVGLLPMAVAGVDIEDVLKGASLAREECSVLSEENDCYNYAIYRNFFYKQGKKVELFASYDPDFKEMSEWCKQLFGESEGKDKKGLFPASVTFSTDLHSLGQFVQDGSPILFETVIDIQTPKEDLIVEKSLDNFDGLDFLAGKSFAEINKKAMMGTILAHVEGGVPNLKINIKDSSAFTFGYLVYFFMRACAISGYMLGVNPFDQPGVEAYKKNMFALLHKPGYEELGRELEVKLK